MEIPIVPGIAVLYMFKYDKRDKHRRTVIPIYKQEIEAGRMNAEEVLEVCVCSWTWAGRSWITDKCLTHKNIYAQMFWLFLAFAFLL